MNQNERKAVRQIQDNELAVRTEWAHERECVICANRELDRIQEYLALASDGKPINVMDITRMVSRAKSELNRVIDS